LRIAVALILLSAGPVHAQTPLPFRPPASGTVLSYNGVDYVFGGTHKGLTRLTLRFGRQSTRVTLHLRDLLLTEFRRVGRQKAAFQITVAQALWPLRLGASYRYSWRARIDGRNDGGGRGTLRVFSAFDTLDAAGKRFQVVLIVKDQTWTNRRGDRFRSRQNLFYAPALGFWVKEERFLFRNGRALPPIVLILKGIRRPAKN
jgi:hypothetical protein